ncbi:unnamed protein product [Linum trigynum]|uniref:U-box domain-containing protein n=1 Tax=Linum trigynum TaxID=586398 RepID=A0AAV2CS15_9ROSI
MEDAQGNLRLRPTGRSPLPDNKQYPHRPNHHREWLDRGNSSCPITCQKLTITLLPKTNYVLKRLIATWLEQNLTSSSPSIETPLCRRKSATAAVGESTTPSLSPNSVIVAAAVVDGSVAELRHTINNLCMTEILDESEAAVLKRLIQDRSISPHQDSSLPSFSPLLGTKFSHLPVCSLLLPIMK